MNKLMKLFHDTHRRFTRSRRMRLQPRKLISMFTVLCFMISVIGTDIAHAIVSGGNEKAIENSVSFIPFHLGRVIESKTFDNSRYTVININDLHCHIEAQKNIEQIIENLQKNYKISAIFVEGGYDEVDTSIFGRVKDEKLRNNIIEGLFEKGRLTGAEYYYLKNDVKTPFYGLEDKNIHRQNIERLSKALDNNEKYKEKLSEIKDEIEYLKAKYFSRENHRFTATFESYKSGRMPMERYYALLRKYIGKLDNNDDKYNSLLPISFEKYPIFTLYCELLKTSKKIDYNKATYEMQVLVNHLKENLSYNEYSKLSLATAGFSNVEELGLRMPALTKKYGINIDARSSLGQLIAYIEASRQINPVAMLDEERRVAEDIRIAFSSTPEEIEISFLSDFFTYLEAFLNTKITADDYEFFEKEYPRFEKIYSKYAFKNTLSSMKEEIDFLVEYYRVNKDRNAIFAKNIEKRLDKNAKDEIVIVVAGGFHSEGLNKIFTQSKVSYISLMPSVTQETKTAEESYNSFLAMGNIFYAQTLALALASQAQLSEIMHLMIETAASSLSSLAYNKNNIDFIIQSISEAAGENISYEYGEQETVITLSNGFKITLKNTSGKIKSSAAVNETVIAKNKLNLSAAVSASATSAAGAVSLHNTVFNPQTYKTVTNIMKFAAKNNLVTGDGLIFDIETDPALGEKIAGMEKELLARMPDSVQNAVLRYHQRKDKAATAGGITRAFITAYYASELDQSVLDRVFLKAADSADQEISEVLGTSGIADLDFSDIIDASAVEEIAAIIDSAQVDRFDTLIKLVDISKLLKNFRDNKTVALTLHRKEGESKEQYAKRVRVSLLGIKQALFLTKNDEFGRVAEVIALGSVLTELLTNAFIHGNHADPDLNIYISADLENGIVKMANKISDGFLSEEDKKLFAGLFGASAGLKNIEKNGAREQRNIKLSNKEEIYFTEVILRKLEIKEGEELNYLEEAITSQTDAAGVESFDIADALNNVDAVFRVWKFQNKYAKLTFRMFDGESADDYRTRIEKHIESFAEKMAEIYYVPSQARAKDNYAEVIRQMLINAFAYAYRNNLQPVSVYLYIQGDKKITVANQIQVRGVRAYDDTLESAFPIVSINGAYQYTHVPLFFSNDDKDIGFAVFTPAEAQAKLELPWTARLADKIGLKEGSWRRGLLAGVLELHKMVFTFPMHFVLAHYADENGRVTVVSFDGKTRDEAFFTRLKGARRIIYGTWALSAAVIASIAFAGLPAVWFVLAPVIYNIFSHAYHNVQNPGAMLELGSGNYRQPSLETGTSAENINLDAGFKVIDVTILRRLMQRIKNIDEESYRQLMHLAAKVMFDDVSYNWENSEYNLFFEMLTAENIYNAGRFYDERLVRLLVDISKIARGEWSLADKIFSDFEREISAENDNAVEEGQLELVGVYINADAYEDSPDRYIGVYEDGTESAIEESEYYAFSEELIRVQEERYNAAMAELWEQYEGDAEQAKAEAKKIAMDAVFKFGKMNINEDKISLPYGVTLYIERYFENGKGFYSAELRNNARKIIGKSEEVEFAERYRIVQGSKERLVGPLQYFALRVVPNLVGSDSVYTADLVYQYNAKLSLPLLRPLNSLLKLFGVSGRARETVTAVIELPLVMIAAYSPAFNETFIKWHRSKTAQQVRDREWGMKFIRRSMDYAWRAAANRATSSSPLIRTIQRITFGIAGMISANIKAHVKYNLDNPGAKLNLSQANELSMLPEARIIEEISEKRIQISLKLFDIARSTLKLEEYVQSDMPTLQEYLQNNILILEEYLQKFINEGRYVSDFALRASAQKFYEQDRQHYGLNPEYLERSSFYFQNGENNYGIPISLSGFDLRFRLYENKIGDSVLEKETDITSRSRAELFVRLLKNTVFKTANAFGYPGVRESAELTVKDTPVVMAIHYSDTVGLNRVTGRRFNDISFHYDSGITLNPDNEFFTVQLSEEEFDILNEGSDSQRNIAEFLYLKFLSEIVSEMASDEEKEEIQSRVSASEDIRDEAVDTKSARSGTIQLSDTNAIVENLRAAVNEDKKVSIVFVCTANVFRSATADVLFKQFLKDNGKKNIDVFSAGIRRGYQGRELLRGLKKALGGKVDEDILDSFRSKRITAVLNELGENNRTPDYIITVSEEHREFLLKLAEELGINLNVVLFSELSPELPELADGHMPDPSTDEITADGLVELLNKIFAENFAAASEESRSAQIEALQNIEDSNRGEDNSKFGNNKLELPFFRYLNKLLQFFGISAETREKVTAIGELPYVWRAVFNQDFEDKFISWHGKNQTPEELSERRRGMETIRAAMADAAAKAAQKSVGSFPFVSTALRNTYRIAAMISANVREHVKWNLENPDAKLSLEDEEDKYKERIAVLESIGINNEAAARFAKAYRIDDKKLREGLSKYAKEDWFKELFSGDYNINFLTLNSIEKMKVLADDFGIEVNDETIGFIVNSNKTIEVSALRKYAKEDWFKELFSGNYSINRVVPKGNRSLTLDGIKRMEILASFEGGIKVNANIVEFVCFSEIRPGDLQRLSAYEEKDWFKKLFSGNYDISRISFDGIRKVGVLADDFDIEVNEGTIRFVMAHIREWKKWEDFLKKHKEFIKEKVSKEGIGLEEAINFVMNTELDEEMLNRLNGKKNVYKKILQIKDLFAYTYTSDRREESTGTPQEIVDDIIKQGKLSFKELVALKEYKTIENVPRKYMAQHNLNKTDEDAIQELKSKLEGVEKIISAFTRQYDLVEFFEMRTNYTLAELLQDDNKIGLFIDEIVYAMHDVQVFLEDKKSPDEQKSAKELEKILQGYYFVRGEGIEYSLSMRNIDNYEIGERTGDCTGSLRQPLQRVNYRSKWLMHKDYEVLQMFIDGKFTNRFDFIISESEGKSVMFIHAQENIPQFRDGTSSLIDRRDIAYYEALKYLMDFAKERGCDSVLINYEKEHNSNDIAEKKRSVQSMEGSGYGGTIAKVASEISLQEGYHSLLDYGKVEAAIEREKKLLEEQKRIAADPKFEQIQRLIKNGMFSHIYAADDGYIIRLSDDVAMKFSKNEQGKKERLMLNFVRINDRDLSSYRRRKFAAISAQEKSALLNAGVSANFNEDIFDSLDMTSLSISVESLFQETNDDRLSEKLKDLHIINWDKLYRLDDGSYAVVMGKPKSGKQAIIRYKIQDVEKIEHLKLAGKIEEITEKIAKSDKLQVPDEIETIKNGVKGLLLNKKIVTNDVRSLIITGKFEMYIDFEIKLDGSQKTIIFVFVESKNKIYKLPVEYISAAESVYIGQLDYVEALPDVTIKINENTKKKLQNVQTTNKYYDKIENNRSAATSYDKTLLQEFLEGVYPRIPELQRDLIKNMNMIEDIYKEISELGYEEKMIRCAEYMVQDIISLDRLTFLSNDEHEEENEKYKEDIVYAINDKLAQLAGSQYDSISQEDMKKFKSVITNMAKIQNEIMKRVDVIMKRADEIEGEDMRREINRLKRETVDEVRRVMGENYNDQGIAYQFDRMIARRIERQIEDMGFERMFKLKSKLQAIFVERTSDYLDLIMSPRLLPQMALAKLTLPETQKAIEERGYTGIKAYLYTGCVELGKLLFMSSKHFAALHDNFDISQYKTRVLRTRIVKAIVFSLTIASVLTVSFFLPPVAGLMPIVIKSGILLSTAALSVPFFGIIIHALNNFIEDVRLKAKEIIFTASTVKYLEDKLDIDMDLENNVKVLLTDNKKQIESLFKKSETSDDEEKFKRELQNLIEAYYFKAIENNNKKVQDLLIDLISGFYYTIDSLALQEALVFGYEKVGKIYIDDTLYKMLSFFYVANAYAFESNYDEANIIHRMNNQRRIERLLLSAGHLADLIKLSAKSKDVMQETISTNTKLEFFNSAFELELRQTLNKKGIALKDTTNMNYLLEKDMKSLGIPKQVGYMYIKNIKNKNSLHKLFSGSFQAEYRLHALLRLSTIERNPFSLEAALVRIIESQGRLSEDKIVIPKKTENELSKESVKILDEASKNKLSTGDNYLDSLEAEMLFTAAAVSLHEKYPEVDLVEFLKQLKFTFVRDGNTEFIVQYTGSDESEYVRIAMDNNENYINSIKNFVESIYKRNRDGKTDGGQDGSFKSVAKGPSQLIRRITRTMNVIIVVAFITVMSMFNLTESMAATPGFTILVSPHEILYNSYLVRNNTDLEGGIRYADAQRRAPALHMGNTVDEFLKELYKITPPKSVAWGIEDNGFYKEFVISAQGLSPEEFRNEISKIIKSNLKKFPINTEDNIKDDIVVIYLDNKAILTSRSRYGEFAEIYKDNIGIEVFDMDYSSENEVEYDANNRFKTYILNITKLADEKKSAAEEERQQRPIWQSEGSYLGMLMMTSLAAGITRIVNGAGLLLSKGLASFSIFSALQKFFGSGAKKDFVRRIFVNYSFTEKQVSFNELDKPEAFVIRVTETSVPVYMINKMPLMQKRFNFRPTGVKIGNKSVWMSSEKDMLVIFAEGADLSAIEDAVKNDNSKITNELSKLIGKATGVSIKEKVVTDWVNINAEAETTGFEYDEKGNVRANLSVNDSAYGRDIAYFITGIRDIKNADTLAAVQNIYYFLDNVNTKDDLISCLSDFQKTGNGQIILDYQILRANLSEAEIKNFFNTARANGIKIIADLRQDAADFDYRAIGFDGVLRKNSKDELSVYDFALASEQKASEITGYNNSGELITKLQETGDIKILNNNEVITKIASDDRSFIDKIWALRVLKDQAILASVGKNKYTADFVKNSAYNLSDESLAALDKLTNEKIAELLNMLKSGNVGAVRESLNLKAIDPLDVYLNDIELKVEDKTEVKSLQAAYLEGVLEKALISKTVVGTITNKTFEKQLGKALRIQTMSGKETEPVENADAFKERVRQETAKQTAGMKRAAADKIFSRNLQNALAEKVNELAEDAFIKEDSAALSGIIELIPAIAEVRLNIDIDKSSTAQFDVRELKSLLSAA